MRVEQLFIYGAGGFARELEALARQCKWHKIKLIDKGDESKDLGEDYDIDYFAIGIGKPQIREFLDVRLQHLRFIKLIAPSANLMDGSTIRLDDGAVICGNCILTTNITIGRQCQLNLSTTIGHDCVIGDYFTTAPGVHISGNCKIGNRVYFGTNSCVIEGISICDDVIIGAGAVVNRDITQPGTYVGVPAKRLNK